MAQAVTQEALELHRRLRGKIAINPKAALTEETLELYTPGVGAVSRQLVDDPGSARELTWQANSVAVVSDGSAVLGLGDEGPVAALPVLEGKALLFRALAGIDVVPIALEVSGTDEFVQTAGAIAPGFGAINLEDVAAPACFEIEARLRERLDVPVLHDDQHGTAVVVLAALVNAARVTGRDLSASHMVIVGAGAGGAATARLLRSFGVERISVTDSHSALGPGRDDLDHYKRSLVEDLSLDDEGEVGDAATGADILIGLSVPSAFSVEEVRRLADHAIVLALAKDLDGISKQTMEDHYKLYEGYIKKTNECRKLLNEFKYSEIEGNQVYSQLRAVSIDYTFALLGYRNHELYFGHLGGDGGEPGGRFAELVESEFHGGLEEWHHAIRKAATAARGWVMVGYDLNDGSIFNYLMDTQNLWAVYNMVPVLALDVYEHAYARDYGAAPDGRKQYVEAFFRNIDWDHVNRQVIQAEAAREGAQSTGAHEQHAMAR